MFHPIQRFQEKRPEIREKSRRGAGHVIFSRGLLVALLLVTVLLLLRLRPTSTSFWLTLAPLRSVLSRLSARSQAWA